MLFQRAKQQLSNGTLTGSGWTADHDLNLQTLHRYAALFFAAFFAFVFLAGAFLAVTAFGDFGPS